MIGRTFTKAELEDVLLALVIARVATKGNQATLVALEFKEAAARVLQLEARFAELASLVASNQVVGIDDPADKYKVCECGHHANAHVGGRFACLHKFDRAPPGSKTRTCMCAGFTQRI